MKKILLGIFITVVLQGLVWAEVRSSVEDKMISSTIKSLAKAYVATADIEKLKKKNIERIRKMDAARFRQQYDDAYETLKDLPHKLKVRYSIKETMTKEQAIANIVSLDKKTIYETIDAVPDAIVAEQVRLRLKKDKPDGKPATLMEKVGAVWNSLVKKISREDEARTDK